VSLYCCLLVVAPDAQPEQLERVARACSPRVERISARAAMFDAAGLERVIGPPESIAREVTRLAALAGFDIHLALAPSMTAAWLLAQGSSAAVIAGSTPPEEAVAGLPLGHLETLAELDSRGAAASRAGREYRRLLSAAYADRCAILHRWGLSTLGDLARLPAADIHARLGPPGTRLHLAARGGDDGPLRPAAEPAMFVERVDLEWPLDQLEPVAFVMARPMARLAAALERADRGAAAVTTTCHLVTRETHARVLHLPAPIDDAAVLRTLVLLDLEVHPPPAAIDAIVITIDPVPRRILQRSLIDRAGTSPEQTATLVARLSALMGERRVGRPVLLDRHDDRAIDMAPWMGGGEVNAPTGARPALQEPLAPGLRRFRLPVAARVTLAHGAPADVRPAARGLAGGEVLARAGPWRSSGHWWTADGTAWDRDEWDLELTGGVVYRLVRDRRTGSWTIEGILD
jgi:protein ImuB